MEQQQQHFSVSGSCRSQSSSSSSSNVVSEGEETTPGVEIQVYCDDIQNLDCGSNNTAVDGGKADHDKETPGNDDDDDYDEEEHEEEDDMVNTQTT